MIRVAQIGAGRMGTLHARNAAAHPRLQLAWIVDSDAGAAERLAAETGAAAASLETVLGDEEVQGVIVASATSSHLANSLACLGASKAVFCEKPLSLSAAALAEALPALGRSEGPPIFVGFNRRFDPHFRALKERLDAGEIGRLETLHIVNHDPALPSLRFVPTSGGLFKDFTIHDFDMASWLTAEPFVELFAWGGSLIDPAIGELGDVDTAKLILRTASGTICVISNSRRSGYGYDQRIEAFGSRGALSVGNLVADTVERWSEEGPGGSPILHGFAARYANAYRAELDHFALILANGELPQTGPRDSLRALRLAEAAARSLESNAPVHISPEQEKHA
jgi:myo-inositol 2-dehydrogenase/D-chiro-inositol 1-dehydrogenase